MAVSGREEGGPCRGAPDQRERQPDSPVGFGPLHWPWGGGLQPPCFVRKTRPSPTGPASVEGCPSPQLSAIPSGRRVPAKGPPAPSTCLPHRLGTAPTPELCHLSHTTVRAITANANQMDFCALRGCYQGVRATSQSTRSSDPPVLIPLRLGPPLALLPHLLPSPFSAKQALS